MNRLASLWETISKRSYLGLAILLTIYLAVTLTYGFLNPLGEGPDEVANVELIHFISKQGHLPLNDAERQAAGYKSDWPMLLYHAPIGMATRWIDYNILPSLKKLDNHLPRRLLVEDDFARFALIHTDDEAFPYQGIVLLWHLARLVPTLFSAGTLVVIYVIVLTVRLAQHPRGIGQHPRGIGQHPCGTGDHWLALGVTAVVAAMPEFHFTASVAHEDSVLGLFSALFTLTLLRAWQRPRRYRTYVWLGLWFGLALTAKYSVGLVPLLVAAVLVSAIRRRELGWRAAIYRLLLFTATATGIAMWWFIYVEWYFNKVKELGLVAGLLKPLMASGIDVSMRRVASLLTGGTIPAPANYSEWGALTSDAVSPARVTLWDWAMTLFRPFWFIKWPADTAVMMALSLSFLGLCGLAAAGLWRAWRRREDLPWPILVLLALQIGLLLPFPLLRFYLTSDLAMAAQGRHILFPAAAAIGLLLILGVSAWFPPAYRRFIGPGLAGILLVISLVSFFGYVLPLFPPRLPVRTSADVIEGVPNPVNVSFGNAIELVGYQVGEANKYDALPVTLLWRSLAYADHDYLIELSLLDEVGAVHSLWLGHPVDGHYPTRAWDPGDVVRDTVWLPLMGLEAGDYRLQLRLRSSFDPSAGLRAGLTYLPPTDKAGFLLPTSYSYLPSTTSHLSAPYPFIVWHAGQPASGMPTYHYRSAVLVTLLPGLPSMASESQIPLACRPGQANPKSPWPAVHLPVLAPPRGPGCLHPRCRQDRQTPDLKLVGPDGVEQTPQAQVGDTHPTGMLTYIFLVGAHWPSGEYRLRVRSAPNGVQGVDEAIESDPILRVQVRPRDFNAPPMSTEVRANFGDEIILLGFDFPQRRVKPGDALPIALYWQAQRPVARHYIVSNHLLNRADLRQWGGQDRIPHYYYSTMLWAPGEVVRDEYLVPVDPSAPPGIYFLDIGLYVELVGQRWHLPLVKDGTVLDANSVSIAPIKVGGPPPGITIEDPSPQYPRADNLGNLVTLQGYDLSLEPEALNLTLYWHCDAPLPIDYTTFVHVRDTTGQITGQPGTVVAQMDRPPADGAYPTSVWDPGEIVRDSVQVPVPSEVPQGEWVGIPAGYEIIVGLYDFETGSRLPVLDDRGEPSGDYIQLE